MKRSIWLVTVMSIIFCASTHKTSAKHTDDPYWQGYYDGRNAASKKHKGMSFTWFSCGAIGVAGGGLIGLQTNNMFFQSVVVGSGATLAVAQFSSVGKAESPISKNNEYLTGFNDGYCDVLRDRNKVSAFVGCSTLSIVFLTAMCVAMGLD